MVNDNMQIKIMAGKVKIKPAIDHFTTTGVTLCDGSTLEVDTVIFATGYRIAAPLVDRSIIQGIQHYVTSCHQVEVNKRNMTSSENVSCLK